MDKSIKILASIVLLALLIAAGGYFIFRSGNSEEAIASEHREDEHAMQATPATGGLAVFDKNGDGVVYQDGMHPQIVQDEPGLCPICGMELTPVRVDGQEEGVVRIDPVTIQNIGVRTATVAVEPLARTVRTTGVFESDESSRVAVSLKVGGWVEKLFVDYDGARVRKGQPLLELYSPDLVSTQEEYLLAYRSAQRMGSGPAAQDAARLLEAARRRLGFWDISEAQIRSLEEAGTPSRTLTLYAPTGGTVITKNVFEGQNVMPGQTLLEIADLSRVWLMVDVYEQDLGWVERGTAASVELPYEPGQKTTGRVDYIYDTLDPSTRVVKARVTLPNPGLRFKPGMYATVTLVGKNAEPMPVIPAEALIRSGDTSTVILALGDGRFRPVEVTTGAEAEGRIQVLSGLAGGEEVVTSAQFLIDSEARLKSAIGAMAAGHDHGNTQAGETSPAPSAQAPGHGEHAEPQVQNGVQEVRIIAGGPDGFDPSHLTLTAGVPARLIFKRISDQTCATEVQIPDFGIEPTPLPLDQEVKIEFTPHEAGSFTFACGMDMFKSTILVRS